eukprot:m.38699 g.38699  ORF g.38699 m.38699 type:complete len:170 (-) comp5694_c0_seq1:99-608(-)
MPQGYIFVTVGSTEFDRLIEAVGTVTFAQRAASLGYSRLLVQYGRGKARVDPAAAEHLEIEAYDYKPSLADDMAGAAVIVSHAGAGTCLEVLGMGKPLLVVVNDFLADNHQQELAAKLQAEGYLEYTTPDKLEPAFCNLIEGGALKPYRPGDPTPFAQWLGALTRISTN